MWRNTLVCLALATLASAASLNSDPFIDVVLKKVKTSADRIREHGYPAESHFVETSDGYVLNLFRIPYSPKLNNEIKDKPVVFIMHGQFSCSDCFLLNGPDNALAFNFADAGFDVWLGNARGNIYSRNNTKISLNYPHFWRFSWHEIGVVDIPESLDYILETTGESTLHYVGHSQGTTVFFALMSSRPEYNAKIRTAHMLAPAVFMGNTTDGLAVLLAPYVGEPGIAANLFADQQFIPSNPLVQRVLDTACGGTPTFPEYCRTLFLMWAGTEQSNLNVTLLPQVAETHPAGISTNQGMHYIQLYVSNMFRQFDHGIKKNLKVYNQEFPPDYPIEKITANMHIYYGLADTSANAQDIQRLPQHLPNIKVFHEVPDPTWGHMDFVFALQVKDVINDQVIQYCNDYDEKNNL